MRHGPTSLVLHLVVMDDMALPSSEYRDAVAKEIERVTHSDGMYITDSSSIPVMNFEKFLKDGTGELDWFTHDFATKFLVKIHVKVQP